MNKTILILLSSVCLTVTAFSQADLTPHWNSPDAWFRYGNPAPGWPEVRLEARPGSYWWWPASAVEREDLTWNIEIYQKAGWGSMGVIGIYGVKGEEKKTIPIFTPEWFAMFNHTVTEAKQFGMNIDLTPSSGWRLGGPHVTQEYSERSFAVKNGKIEIKELQERVKRAGPGGDLRKRSLYRTQDISKLLRAGDNCIGLWLGRGRSRSGIQARVQIHMTAEAQDVVVGTDSHGRFHGALTVSLAPGIGVISVVSASMSGGIFLIGV